MAFLIVEKGDPRDLGQKFSLGAGPLLIGRGTEFSPDVVLHDTCISRRHAEIKFENDHFELCDLHSTNGTFINGFRIEPDQCYPLKHDSLIGLGVVAGNEARVLLRFKDTSTVTTTRIPENLLNEENRTKWLRIDEEKCEIWIDAALVTVSKKEYALLVYLHSKTGKVCQRDDLIANVWPEVADAAGVSDAAIDQLVHRLRIKIELDPLHPQHLISRKGFGYMLI